MVRTGIKLDLDISDLVSNASRAQSSLAALNDAMKKANQAGNVEEAGKIAYEIDRLENRNFAYDLSYQNTVGNPNFQAQVPTGPDAARTEQAYIDVVKSQIEAMDRLSTEFNRAIENGEISKAQAISTQIDRQQDDIFRAIRGNYPIPDLTETTQRREEQHFQGFPRQETPPDIDVRATNTPPPEPPQPEDPFLAEIRRTEEALKAKIDAIERLNADFEKAYDAGDGAKMQEISYQLDTLEGERSKAMSDRLNAYAAFENQGEPPPETVDPLRDLQRQPGPPPPFPPQPDISQRNFPDTETDTSDTRTETRGQRSLPRLDSILGDYIASAETVKETIRDIDAQIAKAKENKDGSRVGQLYAARENLKTTSQAIDTTIQTLNKNPEFQHIVEKQAAGESFTRGEERVYEKLATPLESHKDELKKNTEALRDLVNAGDTEEIMRQAPQVGVQAEKFQRTVEEASAPTGMRGLEAGIKAIGVNRILGAINEGFSRWSTSLDRSGIVSLYGNGDVMGGQIAEKERTAGLWGGLAQTILPLAGTLIGHLIAPGLGGVLLGGAFGSFAGKATDTALHLPIGMEKTDVAYANLWQQRSADAMSLAALIGDPKLIRESFKIAADAAAHFGYSAEEGMEVMRHAAQQGLDIEEARKETGHIFEYERSTGANRDALASVASMSARYGTGDGLQAAWAGLNASGMTAGQFDEYLRATQRVMEEGISKGINRSSEQVAQNLTMLAYLTNNNPLWQGDNGARRLSEMNAGIEGATSLSTASDIIAYRAARNLVPEGSRDTRLDALIKMENGITPELFEEYMKLTSNAEGGNRFETISRMRQTFNLNWTNATELYDKWADPNTSKAELDALIEESRGKPLPSAESPELDVARTTQAITNLVTQTGLSQWDRKFPDILAKELEKALREHRQEMGAAGRTVDTSNMTPAEALVAQHDVYEGSRRSGNRERIAEAGAALIQAENDMFEYEEASRREWSRMPSATKGLFDYGWTKLETPWKSDEQKADLAAVKDFEAMFKEAIFSGDTDQLQMVSSIFDKLEGLPKDTREMWNRENVINNYLSGENENKITPDIMTDRTGYLLLEAIRELKEALNINVTVESP